MKKPVRTTNPMYLLSSCLSLKIFPKIQVCKFLEVSCLSFLPEYGPKLKEDYVSVGHLPKIQKGRKEKCCSCGLFSCCKSSWQKVLTYFFCWGLLFCYHYIGAVNSNIFFNRSGLFWSLDSWLYSKILLIQSFWMSLSLMHCHIWI
jgi:hypothetical protein